MRTNVQVTVEDNPANRSVQVTLESTDGTARGKELVVLFFSQHIVYLTTFLLSLQSVKTLLHLW